MTGSNQRCLLGLHKRSEVRHRLLHHASRLDYLGQKHLARSEEVAHHAHAIHQRAFDYKERAAEFYAGFFRVDFDVGVDSLHQRVGEPFFDRAAAPLLGLLFADHRAGALERFTMLHQSLRCVGTTIEQHILDEHFELGLDLFVNLQHASVHDAHIHAGCNRVIKKRGVHGFANFVVAAEAERNIRDAAAHLCMRQIGLDPARRVDEVDGVVVVLLHASGDREDVRIEDDVFRRKTNFVDKDSVRTSADPNLVFVGSGLTLLVESHHNCGGAILQHSSRILTELCPRPSFNEIELTIPLPCRHFRPDSMTSHFEESTMKGTLATSGSLASS